MHWEPKSEECRTVHAQAFVKVNGTKLKGDKGRQNIVMEYAHLPEVLVLRRGLKVRTPATGLFPTLHASCNGRGWPNIYLRSLYRCGYWLLFTPLDVYSLRLSPPRTSTNDEGSSMPLAAFYGTGKTVKLPWTQKKYQV